MIWYRWRINWIICCNTLLNDTIATTLCRGGRPIYSSVSQNSLSLPAYWASRAAETGVSARSDIWHGHRLLETRERARKQLIMKMKRWLLDVSENTFELFVSLRDTWYIYLYDTVNSQFMISGIIFIRNLPNLKLIWKYYISK